MPCVRWPPCASSRPRMRSPALASACRTAAFAVAPECGWTLACSEPNSSVARVALGVLVGQHGALRLQDGPRDEVLAGDHLERALLAGQLPVQDGGDLRVDLGQVL